MSIMLHYAGPDKLTALLHACNSYLHTGKLKSNNNFPLSGHVSKHRQSYVEITHCSEHVTFKIPD